MNEEEVQGFSLNCREWWERGGKHSKLSFRALQHSQLSAHTPPYFPQTTIITRIRIAYIVPLLHQAKIPCFTFLYMMVNVIINSNVTHSHNF